MRLHSLKYLVSLAAIFFLIIGCEKNVVVDVPEAEEAIVVEGSIETNEHPVVYLSRTLPFFGVISTTDIIKNTISGATIVISDGTTTDTLIQPLAGIGYYTSLNITGEVGKGYSLTIYVEGKTLTSFTTIPHPAPLDSVWWKVDGNRDSLGYAWAHLTDPDTLGNCYRWYAKRINRYTYGEEAGKVKDSIFIVGPGGVFEDKFFNTKSFDFSFPRGKLSYTDKEDDNNEEEFLFKRGDTIIVKLCSIDRAHFSFWRSEETQVQNNGNPFGSPAPITGNVDGGLGIWGGFSPVFDTIYAQ